MSPKDPRRPGALDERGSAAGRLRQRAEATARARAPGRSEGSKASLWRKPRRSFTS